ncbi:hypothetical protein [Actinoplanes sp. NPDC049802]|uniref:hypothetical protein n=1 Tax=Actinoplanes sp. NPDC049802 TaxID=3154742 RepID=UPI0033DBF1D1
MGSSTHFDWQIGDDVVIAWRDGGTVRFTDLMAEALPVIRGILIAAARRGETITYGELAMAIDRRYHNLQFGDPLDILSLDCEQSGEPSLAPLVVNKKTGAPGDSFVGDPVSGQQECFAYWAAQ